MDLEYPVGATPLDPDDLAGLIPPLSTQQDLNECEAVNILMAVEWAVNVDWRGRLLHVESMREIHRRMFDQTWKWAGRFRTTEKNIGIASSQIASGLKALLDDVQYWIENETHPFDELAVRFHHRLVLVHPFVNGNGRHARLVADLLAQSRGHEPFSWGAESLVETGHTRQAYLEALRSADRHDIEPLISFARS